MNKKKKLVVVSGVLATCMLFSVSAFALSSHGETTGVGDSSKVALSEGNVEKGDVLEKVISEEASEKNMAKIQQVSNFSTATTREKVENILGKPCSTRGTYDLSDEWSMVHKFYESTDGKEIKVNYLYDPETDTEKVSSIELPGGYFIAPDVYTTPENKDYSLKTDLTTEQFKQFVSGETTAEEVRSTVGMPHAVRGSGLIADVYYTVDGDTVGVYYTSLRPAREDGTGSKGVVDEVLIFDADKLIDCTKIV